MICAVCREGLEGIWDPAKTRRVGLIRDFPELLRMLSDNEDDDEFESYLDKYDLLEPEHYVFGHHVDYDSVIRSMEQGCVSCAEFGYMDERHSRDDVHEIFGKLGYYSVFTINLSRRDMPRPELFVYWGEDLSQYFLSMVVHDENDIVNAALPPNTSDTQTWVMVETWLEECLQSHEMCAMQPLGGFVPTRLLELSYCDGQGVFRLVSGAELKPMERYATLSHCWGSEPAEKKLRLLGKTECMLRDGMPVHILPKLFRHAFEVIHRLDINYIWIDRLCIIQDSEEDWRIEAAAMQTVYRNGFLNIAALGAEGDQDGCFFDRDPMQVAPTVLRLYPDGEEHGPLYRLEMEEKSWRSTFMGEPLLSRAWVLQERVLAARNVYFGRKQVFWECCQSNHCETFPRTMLVESSGVEKRASLAPATGSLPYAWKSLINARGSGGGSSSLFSQWDSAVQRYCECSLTFPGDKLVAMSGLAKHMSGKLGEAIPDQHQYLAGLWRASMPENLLWSVKNSGKCRRPPTYRAPSWSWASLDGAIVPFSGNAPPFYVDVVGAHTIPHGDDAHGELLGGHLHLRGPLCVAACLMHRKGPYSTLTPVKSCHRPDTMAIVVPNITNASVKFDTDDDRYEKVYVLLFRADRIQSPHMIDCKGLAFVPVGDLKSIYRRVGYITISFVVDEEDLSHPSEFVHDWPVTTIEII